jgi:hypothetical protein
MALVATLAAVAALHAPSSAGPLPLAPIVTTSRTLPVRCASDADERADLEAARASLERLVGEDGADALDEGGFRFARPPADEAVVVDDIASGLREVEDLASRSFGLARLGLTFWVDLPLARAFVVASLVGFALLCNMGAFGNSPMRFVAVAPSAEQGQYYVSRDGPLVTDEDAFVLWEAAPADAR